MFKMRGIKLSCMLLAIAFFISGMPFSAHAAEEEREQKRVRIGYMSYEGYQNGGVGEVKSGSAYEYYQKVKYYTDWEYVYVYGSISEMFALLEKGEIDIMACVTYSEDRAEKFYFSDESHGSETYFLYTHAENTDISPANLVTLNGKNVGVTLGSYQEMFFREWCEEKGVSCNIVTYKYMEDMRDALTEKEVDAIVDVRILADEKEDTPWRSIYRFASEPLYFAVSKSRPDILQELNDAQAYIVSTDEYYGYEAMKKYHDGVNYHNVYLTPKQEKYIESCGTLKVGYLEGTNPLSFTDKETGKMSGLCAEYLDVMSEAYGIKFETSVYWDENALIEDLLAEKVDIVFPLGMGYWAAEEADIALSTSICSLPMTAIYQKIGEKDTFEKVIVNKNSPTQEGYAMQYYPKASIYYVESTQEALEAIENGAADVYFVRSGSLEYMNKEFRIHEKFRTMGVRDDMEAFMATRTGNTTLSIILDKGISLLTNTQIDAARFRYTFDIGKVSLWQAIKDNIWLVLGISSIVILVSALLINHYRLKSHRRHMEQLVAERDKAEKAERAKTEFLSQMSHDIRTPMNAIIGFTNFIKNESSIETIKTEYVPKIETASNHLLMLINDVLEMSRIDTGKLVFQREVNDIQKIIESVVAVVRVQAEKNELELLTDISVRDQLVYCDRNHLSRVIMNLLSNAVKFTLAGGKVSISVQQKAEAPKGRAAFEIKVSDTGIGMSPDFMGKVFEPFERERTSTVSGMQGTGLGMAIVKNIVETAGDSISVESAPGVGTTFTLNIALMMANEEQKELFLKSEEDKHYSVTELKERFEGKRILLVEDNEFNSTIACAVLENAGFAVDTAEDGKIAVKRVINAPTPDYYDAILMDIQMPVMNGYEATRAIRALEDERANVKIIAVTANAFETDREKAKEVGMDGHVSKPLDVDALYKVLLDVTEK